jgi:membrane protein DedA with SNARE-associated domain
LAWARDLLARRGTGLIIVARFIPGGRTAVTLTAGMTSMNRAKFVVATIIAGVLWATYATLLGYFGGRAFEDNHTVAFVVAFGAALSITALTELVRWLLRRRKARVASVVAQ